MGGLVPADLPLEDWPIDGDLLARELGVERPSWTLPAPYAHWLERYQ